MPGKEIHNRYIFVYIQLTSTLFILDKFYKTTNIIENSNSYYSILLDNRTLKTPFGKELVIRNKLLALAVAEEWNNQKEHIEIDLMHLV